ncbi:cilia- and flagella-associated protein 45-like isoform X2 [Rhodnius prolixus]|uniref:cilia- and flagella-associated protein 45-like isoform X2 n=1 Tax=Rhodnius prolixus TaxID=13249 RepID=UPI003D18CD8E
MQKRNSCKDFKPNFTNEKGKGIKDKCPVQGEFIKNGKHYLRIITHDIVRDIIIPSEQPNVNTAVFTKEDMQKIYEKPEAMRNKSDESFTNEMKLLKEQQATKSALRKRELQSYPVLREYGPRLQQLEVEAEAKANFLTNRAKEIRQEDEDDIKLCNKLILGTKCQAIRDAQVAEKKTIDKELWEEEKRLDDLMELERKRALAREEEKRLEEIKKKNMYIKAIREQVKGNELEREVEAERTVEEQKLLNEAIMKTRLDELHEIQEKERLQEKTREELNKINKNIMELAEMEKKQSKIADLKIKQYMREKAEQEAERELEAAKIRQAKEKELAKLRAAQQKVHDSQAAKDEIRAKRIQEEYELQWRAKEKEVAEQKRRKNEELKADRQRQVQERRQWQELEAAREREEVAKIKMIDEIITEREKEEQAKRTKELLLHRAALLKQINEREAERIRMRRQVFEEGIAVKLESDNRDESLKKTIKKKITAIRSHNVPEKYIEEIERKLKVQSQETN